MVRIHAIYNGGHSLLELTGKPVKIVSRKRKENPDGSDV